MEVYTVKTKIIPGANYKEVEKIALKIFQQIKNKLNEHRMFAQYISKKKKSF